MKRLKWFGRFILWILSGFGFFDKILYLQHGSDYLHPFSPYSFGGLRRGDFLELYNSSDQSNPAPNLLLQKRLGKEWGNRAKFTYQNFLSPWRINHNYR